jgi:5-methylcytosine-specific restriction protein B
MSDWKNIRKEFLKEWSLDKVKQMTLDEYTNLNKRDSFCYWLESKTTDVISIWGGSSYKFGIFKRNPDAEEKELSRWQDGDGEYGWYEKYGKDKDEAFSNVKRLIVQTIEYAIKENFDPINDIDLGCAFKWKIAFMYAPDETLLRIAKDTAFYFLRDKYLNIKTKNISTIQNELIKKKPKEKDFYEYSEDLWNEYYQSSYNENEFKKWLDGEAVSGPTINKYVSRLKKSIPKKLLQEKIYDNKISLFDLDLEDINEINEMLHKDGILSSWNNSKSVGREAGAAVGHYKKFLESSNESYQEESRNKEGENMPKYIQTKPLNQILYGPPGTGKTYKTIDKALEIILEQQPDNEIKDLLGQDNHTLEE